MNFDTPQAAYKKMQLDIEATNEAIQTLYAILEHNSGPWSPMDLERKVRESSNTLSRGAVRNAVNALRAEGTLVRAPAPDSRLVYRRGTCHNSGSVRELLSSPDPYTGG